MYNYLNTMLDLCGNKSGEVIEATLISYVANKTNSKFYYHSEVRGYESLVDNELKEAFLKSAIPIDIELFSAFFEKLLEKNSATEKGVIFTPKYISDYIVENTILNCQKNTTVIDPACGCGIFLISAAEFLHSKLNLSYVDIFNNNIYAIDIMPQNIRRCKILLNLFVLIKGESNKLLNPNVSFNDSLKLNWNEIFEVDYFSYIVGNPPYVNTHDMKKETADYLKETFSTTKSGVCNIFYAFVEHAINFLHPQGKLSYIVPNNFLTIKSAKELRKLLTSNYYLEQVIDLSDNMVFKPVRTYNCIIRLGKTNSKSLEYTVLPATDDIKNSLQNIEFDYLDIDELDSNGWKLVDKATLSNLAKIEGQSNNIKNNIRIGIATLSDELFMVNFDGTEYSKVVDGIKYQIEPQLVKRLYKVPELKKSSDLSKIRRYIIFPYKKVNSGFEIIPESEFKQNFPSTYRYLLSRKDELDKRDNGKKNPVAWYAYGRTQGLSKYGNKLLFPTFAGNPRFMLVEDEYAFFCNGYAVFEPDFMKLPLLLRILNSSVMQYYISNTSYLIEGGYYCYQKKYIEKFSIPDFSKEEKLLMDSMSKTELDEFLIEKYDLTI